MRNCISRLALALAGAAILSCAGRPASASLMATFNLNQRLYENGAPFSDSVQLTPVTDASLPFQQTVSQTTATNSVTATYNAYDNGTTAGLTINSSASLSALNNDVGEGTGGGTEFGGSSTTFSFTQPVNYTIAYQIAATDIAGSFQVSYPYYNIVNGFSPPTFSQTGTMSPNIVYTLNEFWGLNNINNSEPANLSGTDSISLTFTAIPEPGSLSLLFVPLALLRRRGRTIRAQHG